MEASLRTVKLYGDLGKRFGRVHRLSVNSPAEAIRALEANHRGFQNYLIEASDRNVGFQVVNGGAEIESVDQVHDPASREIKIIPRVMGASAGGRILIGAALVAASFLLPGVGIALGATASSFMFSVGASLVLGGVAQLLSPQPSIDGPQEDPENEPSYAFNGPVNTTAQGQPVPICYGRMLVGGAVISASLDIVDVKKYKRVPVEQNRTVIVTADDQFFALGPIPANWKRRELIATFPPGNGVWPDNSKSYRYYYDEWTLVPI